MPRTDYGRIALIPKGDFSGSTQYEQGDIVSYEGSSYLAKARPPLATLPTDTEYWQMSAEKGEKGDTGPEGKQGQKGDKGDNGDTIYEQKLLTIPASGWQPTGSPGLYKYTLTVPVEDITVNDVPDGKVTDATEYVAQNCNLSYTVISGNGTMTFLAESIPEADMVYAYITFKGGE